MPHKRMHKRTLRTRLKKNESVRKKRWSEFVKGTCFYSMMLNQNEKSQGNAWGKAVIADNLEALHACGICGKGRIPGKSTLEGFKRTLDHKIQIIPYHEP